MVRSRRGAGHKILELVEPTRHIKQKSTLTNDLSVCRNAEKRMRGEKGQRLTSMRYRGILWTGRRRYDSRLICVCRGF